mmetsp:Transcript_53931/g.128189  ORF Transcript_53931/g.128189 Transcript_53931/m.128189 type:complete len:264 (-) Transcript_53931:292-1083(-)
MPAPKLRAKKRRPNSAITAAAAPMERRVLKKMQRMRYAAEINRNETACRFLRPSESSATRRRERIAAGRATRLIRVVIADVTSRYPYASSSRSTRSCTTCGRKITMPKKARSKQNQPPAAPSSRFWYFSSFSAFITSWSLPRLPHAFAMRYSWLSVAEKSSRSARSAGSAPTPRRNRHPTSVAHGSSVTFLVPRQRRTRKRRRGARMLPTIWTAMVIETRAVRPRPRSSTISPANTAERGYVPPTPIPRMKRHIVRVCHTQFP